VLRGIFVPEREKVVRGGLAGRRLHNEVLHKFYALPDVIRVIKSRKVRREGHVSLMWEVRNAYKILEEQFGRPRRRWKYNIRTDVREIG